MVSFSTLSVGFRFCILCFETLLRYAAVGEWIDVPQFSDKDKVYRLPCAKQDHSYEIVTQDSTENAFRYENSSNPYNGMDSDATLVNGSVKRMGISTKRKEYVDDAEATIDEYMTDAAKFATKFATTTKEYEVYDRATTVSSTTEEHLTSNEYSDKSTSGNVEEMLRYLPVDILENVHRTLKSQPALAGGKILFLGTFEKTLMAEIESRLALTVASTREKRGAEHYDHGGYDEHDEHGVGFPSIEGALMAISFLTFAVYLVRLVMLLFRNINNTAPTTTPATLFIGRRKRSVYQLDDDAANILASVDGFPYNS